MIIYVSIESQGLSVCRSVEFESTCEYLEVMQKLGYAVVDQVVFEYFDSEDEDAEGEEEEGEEEEKDEEEEMDSGQYEVVEADGLIKEL